MPDGFYFFWIGVLCGMGWGIVIGQLDAKREARKDAEQRREDRVGCQVKDGQLIQQHPPAMASSGKNWCVDLRDEK